MIRRSPAPRSLAVAFCVFALQGCNSDGSTADDAAGAGGASGGATSGGVNGTGSGPAAGAPGTGGAPEPAFDASALAVVGASGPELCRLSDDGRFLVVSVTNAGDTETGPTTVRLATQGKSYELDLKTPTLAAGESAELTFDRGPVVGFVDNWSFSLTVDPDGSHGGPFEPLEGSCRDLRSRAVVAMAKLKDWYHTDSGLWGDNDWWTSANQLETVIDFARETGEMTYFEQIDNTFSKNQAGDFDKWGYYDDDGWWAMAWIKAYDLTHEQKYLDMAKKIFSRMTNGWSSACGGGIYWASPKAGSVGNSNKNAIPNSLFLQIAAKLHLRTPGDGGSGSYLEWAEREWDWFKNTGMITDKHQVVDGLDNLTDCHATGPIFTYNQGVLIGGLVDLAEAKNDPSLLEEATAIAKATMELMATEDGILLEPGCGGDICVQFKGVFMRNLRQLYRANPLPEFLVYARHQSDHLWTASVRNDQDQFGWEWHLPFDKATPGRQSSALDALLAAVGAANLNMALGAAATGSTPCAPTESASRATDGGSRGASKWCSGGMSGQHFEVDLGKPQTIVGFRVRHAGAGGENPAFNTRDFEIETSVNGTTWTNAVAVIGNTDDVTDHPIPSVSARYVRLHVSKAQTSTDFVAARIYELEVLGAGLGLE